jgi:hypothetical protein
MTTCGVVGIENSAESAVVAKISGSSLLIFAVRAASYDKHLPVRISRVCRELGEAKSAP